MPADKVMVLRSDRLGDLVLCSGYLHNLVESHPEFQVDLWLAPDMAPVRDILHPAISVRPLPFDRHLRVSDGVLAGWLQLIQEQRYHQLIVPQFTLGFPEALALNCLAIERRWGFRNHELGVDPAWLSLHIQAEPRPRSAWITDGPVVEPFSHECAKYEALAGSQELPLGRNGPRLSVPGLDRVAPARELLVWPGSGDESRRWPLDRFSETVAYLGVGEVDIGATPPESALARDLQGLLRAVGVAANIEIRQTAELAATSLWLAGYRRVLTNDTGLAHLASACGCSVVSISPAQYQGRFVVHGDSALTIFAGVPCVRCRNQCLFDEPLWPCVAEIDALRVADAIRSHRPGQSFVSLSPNDAAVGPALFARLHTAAQKRHTAAEQERLEVSRAVQSLRSLVAETESARNHWQTLFGEAEGQRDQWQRLFQEAEAQRDGAQRLRTETEEQRDHWQRLFREAEAQRDGAQASLAESNRRSEEWESKCRVFFSLFPWAAGSTFAQEAEQWPKISVVTPSFQQGRFIGENIESVLNQQYPNFEHIIVDAGSSDETVSVLKKYAHLRWVSEPDRGQAHAINKGLLLSRGDIVAYLNSDDVYRPGAFHAVARIFRENPSIRMIVGDCDYIDEGSQVIGHLKARYGRFEDLVRYWGWDKWYCIPQQSVFLRRDLLAETGLFDIQYHMVMDYDMWLRIAQITAPHAIPQTLAAFRLASETKTISRTHLMYAEELHASRRRWNLLPRSRRIAVAFEAHRHIARKLLDVAEHLAFSAQQAPLAAALALDGASKWPLLAFSPRFWLTLLQLGARPLRPVCAGVRIVHRQYLTMLWRMRRFTARRSLS